MKLQTKIFLLFVLSILVTLLTTVPFVFNLQKNSNRFLENRTIEDALGLSMNLYLDKSLKDSEKLNKIIDEVTKINREYTKSKVFKEDLTVNALTSLIIFLVVQTALLLFLVFFITRSMTSQLRAIVTGIRGIESGKKHRIPALRGFEFRLLGNEFNKMLDMMEEKERLLTEQAKLLGWQEVASFLSHQFKNPLTSIILARNNVMQLYRNSKKDDLTRTNLKIIEEETERLSSLVKRMKDLTSFPVLSQEMMSVEQVIEDTSRPFSTDDIEFEFKFSKAGPISLDRQFMEQVFRNLFINSIEASRDRGIPVRISVSTHVEPDFIVILISDSIENLPADIADKVMLPNFTTKKKGSGLGLLFVRKIITLHKGDIGVGITPVGGLEFTIRLPARGLYA